MQDINSLATSNNEQFKEATRLLKFSIDAKDNKQNIRNFNKKQSNPHTQRDLKYSEKEGWHIKDQNRKGLLKRVTSGYIEYLNKNHSNTLVKSANNSVDLTSLNIMLNAIDDENQYKKMKAQGLFLDKAKFKAWDQKIANIEHLENSTEEKNPHNKSVSFFSRKKDRFLSSDAKKSVKESSNKYMRQTTSKTSTKNIGMVASYIKNLHESRRDPNKSNFAINPASMPISRFPSTDKLSTDSLDRKDQQFVKNVEVYKLDKNSSNKDTSNSIQEQAKNKCVFISQNYIKNKFDPKENQASFFNTTNKNTNNRHSSQITSNTNVTRKDFPKAKVFNVLDNGKDVTNESIEMHTDRPYFSFRKKAVLNETRMKPKLAASFVKMSNSLHRASSATINRNLFSARQKSFEKTPIYNIEDAESDPEKPKKYEKFLRDNMQNVMNSTQINQIINRESYKPRIRSAIGNLHNSSKVSSELKKFDDVMDFNILRKSSELKNLDNIVEYTIPLKKTPAKTTTHNVSALSSNRLTRKNIMNNISKNFLNARKLRNLGKTKSIF